METFKVITLNLRKDSRLDFKNRWQYRRSLVADFIRNSGACIIGVQELLPSMKEDMSQALKDYTLFGDGRSKTRCDEHSDIIVKNADVEVDFSRTIWLSKHPNKLGSRAFLAVFPRICTMCEVTFRDSGRQIRVFNAHFDHISKWARILSVKIIWEYIDKFQAIEPMPTVLMGDFNVTPNNPLIQRIRQNKHTYRRVHLVDAYEFCNANGIPVNTYHGFRGRVEGHRQLDYIFVSEDLQIVNTYVDRTEYGGKYLSDHYPIVATLAFK